MASRRVLERLAVPAAALLLGGCTTLGPDFTPPQAPWLQGWSGGAARMLADEAPHRAQPRDDEWWRYFDDPVLDQLVAEAQRLNPGVRTAGMRIMEARAQLGIAGSALYPQLQQIIGEALRTSRGGTDGRSTGFWSAGLFFDLAWELDFWGKFKRGIESADAAYFSSIAQYDDVQVLVAAQTASLYATIARFFGLRPNGRCSYCGQRKSTLVEGLEGTLICRDCAMVSIGLIDDWTRQQ